MRGGDEGMSGDAYAYDPPSGPGNFLRLTDKGQQATFRLVSAPVRQLVIWKGEEKRPIESEKVASLSEEQLDEVRSAKNAENKPKYRLSEQFTWIVIDREDGKARYFTGTAGVYKKIKTLVENEKWGDPTKYDITVTRTQEPGNAYYDLMPDPEKSDVSDEEKELANELDLAETFPYAIPTGDSTQEKQSTAILEDEEPESLGSLEKENDDSADLL